LVNTTSTIASSHGHVDVAALTPASAPRVTDDVVRSGNVTVVTDCCDGMVARVGAVRGNKDTTGVGLEFESTCVHSDSSGLCIESTHDFSRSSLTGKNIIGSNGSVRCVGVAGVLY